MEENMITSIKICNAGTFNDKGQKIDNLKKINFFYGANGSGKTTISRILDCNTNYPDSKVFWEKNVIEKIVVYNQDFVKKNFSSCSDIPGIYTLGEGAIEVENNINKLKSKYKQVAESKSNLLNGMEQEKIDDYLNDELKQCTEKYQEKIWKLTEIAKGNEMESLLTGYKRSKSKLFNKLIEYSKINKNSSGSNKILTKNEICRCVRADKSMVPLITHLSNGKLKIIEGAKVFNEPILGKSDLSISRLIETLNNSEWVRIGKSYIDKSDNKCPFCQQILPQHFVDHLEDYFDKAYEQKIQKIKEYKECYKVQTEIILKDINNLSLLHSEELNQEKFKVLKNRLNSILNENQEKIDNKLKAPAETIELENSSEIINKINQLIDDANNRITEFNNAKKGEVTVKDITAAFWDYATHLFEKDIKEYLEEKQAIGTKYGSIKEKINAFDSEIRKINISLTDLEKQRVSIKPTVDKINRILESFGFNNFKLCASSEDSKYQIVRPGGALVGETLSEGERNFITFLYFYFLLEGSVSQSNNLGGKVIVIDDPVSSLDSNVLYIVCTLLSNLCTEKILKGQNEFVQLMLFTHNVYFYNELEQNVSRRIKTEKREKVLSYYIIRKTNNNSVVEYYKHSPIKTTYRMMWDIIKTANEDINQIDKIALLNIMRRILEYYFKTLGNYDNKKIYDNMENEERFICHSLLIIENSQSHSFIDDIINSTPDEQTLRKYLSVFRKIFQVSGNRNHYNMMMGIEE